jgi:ubiquinone/menaquinone biosynthesis methyltransferase
MIQRFKSISYEQKKIYNQQLFKVVAPRYDMITRLLSFNRDVAWKRKLLNALPSQSYKRCLDIACGTGDLTIALAEKFPEAQIYGLDLTPAMIELARHKNNNEHVHFVVGDMNNLTWDGNSVDLITGGYALRNAPDLKGVLAECYRVLKPGGIAAFLDFSKPESGWAQRVEYGLLKGWGGLWGLVFHANPAVYGYIAESLVQFPNRVQLHKLLAEMGFKVLENRRFFGGIIELVVCQKQES